MEAQAHFYRRVPLRYDAQYWGAVVPLGMYTACTLRMAEAIDLPFLLAIPRAFIWVALLAWVLTAFGLVRRVVNRVRGGVSGVS